MNAGQCQLGYWAEGLFHVWTHHVSYPIIPVARRFAVMLATEAVMSKITVVPLFNVTPASGSPNKSSYVSIPQCATHNVTQNDVR